MLVSFKGFDRDSNIAYAFVEAITDVKHAKKYGVDTRKIINMVAKRYYENLEEIVNEPRSYLVTGKYFIKWLGMKTQLFELCVNHPKVQEVFRKYLIFASQTDKEAIIIINKTIAYALTIHVADKSSLVFKFFDKKSKRLASDASVRRGKEKFRTMLGNNPKFRDR